ncbi:MAG: Flp pilus assembly protein CpaB [Actinomycetes bacterium]
MGRKILLVVAALTMIIAGGALYMSLTSASATPSGPSRTVLVANGDLPPGTSGAALTAAQVVQTTVPANMVPEKAITNLAEVAQLKTTVTIFKGQILIARQFASTNATGGLPIPPGTNAVSIELSDPARVAGFVQPGSQVVVYSGTDTGTTVLLANASVIAVGATTATGTGTANRAVATTIVTFALTPADAAKLVGNSGRSLYLGLLPTTNAATAPAPAPS